MVEGYTRVEMSSKWTQGVRYAAWLEVEKATVKAWNKLGLIPDDGCEKIVKNASFSVERIEEIEAITKHDLVAFNIDVPESSSKESRWFHYGMTSPDAIDTGVTLQTRGSLKVIIDNVKILMESIKKKALEHKFTLMAGRSHGIHGEPIVFGSTLVVWYDEVVGHLKNLEETTDVIAVGQVSGAMGNFAHAPPELGEYAMAELGLKPGPCSNQVIHRDRYTRLTTALTLLASSVEKFAVQVKHLQRTEVHEAGEYFAKGQERSSAMPHKRNPILTEDITGLARMIRAYAIPAMENVALWHERDISHSSTERFWLPDAFITADFMLHRVNSVIASLTVMPENMMENLNLTGGLVLSQRILLELPLQGVSREDAYRIVQRNTIKVWEEIRKGKPTTDEKGESLYLQYLLSDEELRASLSEEQIRECFNPDYYTKNADAIFKRVSK